MEGGTNNVDGVNNNAGVGEVASSSAATDPSPVGGGGENDSPVAEEAMFLFTAVVDSQKRVLRVHVRTRWNIIRIYIQLL